MITGDFRKCFVCGKNTALYFESVEVSRNTLTVSCSYCKHKASWELIKQRFYEEVYLEEDLRYYYSKFMEWCSKNHDKVPIPLRVTCTKCGHAWEFHQRPYARIRAYLYQKNYGICGEFSNLPLSWSDLFEMWRGSDLFLGKMAGPLFSSKEIRMRPLFLKYFGEDTKNTPMDRFLHSTIFDKFLLKEITMFL